MPATMKNTPRNPLQMRTNRARVMAVALKRLFPRSHIALHFTNHWELLVAVELSAQCTDKKVNEVTEKLFQKYRTLDEYVRARPKEFEQDIKPTGFYRNKAKNILAAAKIIRKRFDGKLPRTMEEILTIPGVARKTANVVLGNAYGIIKGIAVDTHVKRFAQKFDLTDHTDPKRIEQDLMALLPKKEWFSFTYRLIDYGRNICPARKHDCTKHSLTKLYPPAAQRWPKAR